MPAPSQISSNRNGSLSSCYSENGNGFKCHCREWPGAQTQTRCFQLNELQTRSSIQAESACALCLQQIQGNLSYPHLQGSGLTLTPNRSGLTLQLLQLNSRHLPLAKGTQIDQLSPCPVPQLHNSPQNSYLRNSNDSVFSGQTGTHPLKPPEQGWRAGTLHWYSRSTSAGEAWTHTQSCVAELIFQSCIQHEIQKYTQSYSLKHTYKTYF